MKQLHTIAPFPSSNFICKRRVGLFQDPSVFKTFRVTMEDCRSATYVVNRYPPPAYSYPSPLSSKSKPAALPAFVCDSICSSQFYGDIMLITRDKILNRKAICKHSQKDSKDKKKKLSRFLFTAGMLDYLTLLWDSHLLFKPLQVQKDFY